MARPRQYTDINQMQAVIDNYFTECDEHDKPYTISGLCYALGMERSTLLRYCERNDTEIDLGLCNTIKSAKARILAQQEERLITGKGSTVGLIFSMKNNQGWKDTQDISANINDTVTIDVQIK